MSARALGAAIACAAAIAPWTASAGTLCGTVRDSSTLAPIVGAEAFLYADDGAYTGLTATTDALGAFCFEAPGGTYDLLVRVTDHQDAWAYDLTITDSPTSVEVVAGTGVLFEAWPNPARGPVQLRVRLDDPTPVRIRVFDVQGRQVHGWEGLPSPEGTVIRWSARDSGGSPLAAGIYFARLVVGDTAMTRKVTLIR